MGEDEFQHERADDLHRGQGDGQGVLVAHTERDDDCGDERRDARADEVDHLALEREQDGGRPQIHHHERHRRRRDDRCRRAHDDPTRAVMAHEQEYRCDDEGEHDEEAEQSETEFHTGSSLPFSSARYGGIYPPRPGKTLKIFALP